MSHRAALLLLAAAAGVGCVRSHPSQSIAPLNTTPLVIDEAMQKRDWSPSAQTYASGAVQGWSRRLVYELPTTDKPRPQRAVSEPIVFLFDAAVMPFTLITTPPFTRRTYYGVQTPPTATAVPPLPAPQPSAASPDAGTPAPRGAGEDIDSWTPNTPQGAAPSAPEPSGPGGAPHETPPMAPSQQ